jgi:hypothetical protein
LPGDDGGVSKQPQQELRVSDVPPRGLSKESRARWLKLHEPPNNEWDAHEEICLLEHLRFHDKATTLYREQKYAEAAKFFTISSRWFKSIKFQSAGAAARKPGRPADAAWSLIRKQGAGAS